MPELNTARTVSKNPEVIQLSYGIEQANTYLIVEDRHAVVVDACSSSVVEEIKTRDLIPDFILITHEHVDHLWGLNAVRDAYPNAEVIAQQECSTAILNPKTNKAAQYRLYAILRFGEVYQNKEAENRKYSCKSADVEFTETYELHWHGHRISILHTPGHSPGSSIIFVDDAVAFSGDTILNEETFLKFDDGDEESFTTVTVPIIDSISDEVQILPGHGERFMKRDWKKT